MNKILGLFAKARGRVAWSTILRKRRARREEAYRYLSDIYDTMLQRMWSRVGPPEEEVPKVHFVFDKSDAVGYLSFVRTKTAKCSHLWRMGDPANKQNGTVLKDLTANEEIPYFITREIIAATAISSAISDSLSLDGEAASKILLKYYDTEPYNPLEISRVWMCRLNTTLCNIWQAAPVMKRALEIAEDRGMKLVIAHKLAMEEVEAAELPSCFNSDNGDGRINMSYPGSCFYTIDHRGTAICKEYPSEFLDLSDYEKMLGVAGTIYKDITGCSDDDTGRGGAIAILQEEPEWQDSNLFPWEKTVYVILAWFPSTETGYEHKIIEQFEEQAEALEAFERLKESPPASADALELCLMRDGYFIDDDDGGSIARHEIVQSE